jgi:hypothetical protein
MLFGVGRGGGPVIIKGVCWIFIVITDPSFVIYGKGKKNLKNILLP